MKTLMTLALASSLSAFTPADKAPLTASEKTGLKIITALQHNSVTEYSQLFPTLAELQQVMNANTALYGDYIEEAKNEFAKQYHDDLLPGLKYGFAKIIAEGKMKGIDWSTIEWKNADLSVADSSLVLAFSSKGKEYKLRIEKSFTMNGELKITQKIAFI